MKQERKLASYPLFCLLSVNQSINQPVFVQRQFTASDLMTPSKFSRSRPYPLIHVFTEAQHDVVKLSLLV